ncbi:MAG: hypothetical protein JXA28_08860 [Bacteroidetes bacterium]|nr:hypothetical protein [Bacteroidota bacterium]
MHTNATMATGQFDNIGGEFRLRKLLLVLFLVFMLSFDPGVNTSSVRVDRTAVEYVMPVRRRRLRRRRFPRSHRFSSIESLYCLEG